MAKSVFAMDTLTHAMMLCVNVVIMLLGTTVNCVYLSTIMSHGPLVLLLVKTNVNYATATTTLYLVLIIVQLAMVFVMHAWIEPKALNVALVLISIITNLVLASQTLILVLLVTVFLMGL